MKWEEFQKVEPGVRVFALVARKKLPGVKGRLWGANGCTHVVKFDDHDGFVSVHEGNAHLFHLEPPN